jgi:hypothetical protein
MGALQDARTDDAIENEYNLVQSLWPASTGWLIISILFANKLWISDATSMSLYWAVCFPHLQRAANVRCTSAHNARTKSRPHTHGSELSELWCLRGTW